MNKNQLTAKVHKIDNKTIFENTFPYRAYSLTEEEVRKQIEVRTNNCPHFKSFKLKLTEYGYSIILSCSKECQVCNPHSILSNKTSRVTAKSIPKRPSAPQKQTMKIEPHAKQSLKVYRRNHKLGSLSEAVASLLVFYEVNRKEES